MFVLEWEIEQKQFLSIDLNLICINILLTTVKSISIFSALFINT